MKKSKLAYVIRAARTLSAVVLVACVAAASAAFAQGDLTGGVGQFIAAQPKKEKTVKRAARKFEKPKAAPGVPRPKETAEDKLLEAAGGGDAAAVEDLLRRGANVNAKSGDGCTPLIYAVAGG